MSIKKGGVGCVWTGAAKLGPCDTSLRQKPVWFLGTVTGQSHKLLFLQTKDVEGSDLHVLLGPVSRLCGLSAVADAQSHDDQTQHTYTWLSWLVRCASAVYPTKQKLPQVSEFTATN